jgi:hypothetical protein
MGTKLHLLKGENLYVLLEIILEESVASSPILFNCVMYRLTHIYFVLWVMIQCYIIYFIVQIVPTLATGRSLGGC